MGRQGATSPAAALPEKVGRARPVIAEVRPTVDGGRYPAKGALGEAVAVEADIFADGHDELLCEVRFRHEEDSRWQTAGLEPLGNDRWRGEFEVTRAGRYRFAIRATIDRFDSWRRALQARAGAGQPLDVELLVGAELVRQAAARAAVPDRRRLAALADALDAAAAAGPAEGLELAGSAELGALMARHRDPRPAATSKAYPIEVERARARYSSWYELFPRSTSPDPDRPGTLADVEARLPYVARLGFDVLYLPPIHPIGVTARKGRNGVSEAGPDDPGSPWAIGNAAGGHTAIDPDLGTLADFDRLVAAAAGQGIEVALDLTFQCSPDHPWVDEHPDWFRRLPDGNIRPAENPPKSYEDVYPLDFETPDWCRLWEALHGVVEFWIGHGVRMFRVDNPHTKPLRFWEWLLATVRADHPEVIMLAEAFTRPRIMEHLAKVGFSQSYTYFTWRNSARELEEYLTELTRTPVADYFRPNFWPNTPDILHEFLQSGGRPAFMARLILAATLGASYGIYGPAFELLEHESCQPGSEEYLDSEKYEVRHWDLDRPDSLADLLSRVNAIRHAHPALHQDRSLRFHGVDNDQLLVYSKTAGSTPGGAGFDDTVLVAVNVDPRAAQGGTIALDLAALRLERAESFVVHDLLTGARYDWSGPHNYIRLDPEVVPAHIFHVERPGV
jgi:starch synthase (maltosyl-transferring)